MFGGWVVDLVPPVGVLAVRQGAVAQLGERRNRTAEVCGSIPHSSTTFPGGPWRVAYEVRTERTGCVLGSGFGDRNVL